jgi:hypothetical protein
MFGKGGEIGVFHTADRSRFFGQRGKPFAWVHALPFIEQFAACRVEALRPR